MRYLHRVLLILTVVALSGCEFLGIFPDGNSPSPATVDVVNQTDESVYVMAVTQEVMSRIFLNPEIEPEEDHPQILAPGERLRADFDDGLQRDEVAVFVLYVKQDEGEYRLSAIIDRTYQQLRRESFRFAITPQDLNQITFEVHLNNSFDDDRVRVWIDDREVFDGRVTTDYVWSLAEIIHLAKSAGRHEIEVQVNDGEPESWTFDLDRPLYIHVRYYPEDLPAFIIKQGVFFEVTDEPPMYD